MELSKDMLRHLAQLSRLEAAAAEGMGEDLSKILDYMERLNAVDVSSLAEEAIAAETVLRADVACPSYPREVLLAGAPEQDGIGFLVPRTVEL